MQLYIFALLIIVGFLFLNLVVQNVCAQDLSTNVHFSLCYLLINFVGEQ